jgi:hypothetical protein
MSNEKSAPSELERVMHDRNIAAATTQQALANAPPVTVIPQDREQELNIDHPGHIKYASQKDGGKYVGCKLESFLSVKDINDFFEKQSNLVVIEMFPPDSGMLWHVLYTNQMEREEMELYLQLQDAYARVKDDLMRERALAKQKEEEELVKEEKEMDRLVTIGKKCESNHGKTEKMAQRIAELEAQVLQLMSPK